MAKRPTKVQKNPHLHIISEEIFLVNKSKFQTTSGMSKEAYKKSSHFFGVSEIFTTFDLAVQGTPLWK